MLCIFEASIDVSGYIVEIIGGILWPVRKLSHLISIQDEAEIGIGRCPRDLITKDKECVDRCA